MHVSIYAFVQHVLQHADRGQGQLVGVGFFFLIRRSRGSNSGFVASTLTHLAVVLVQTIRT